MIDDVMIVRLKTGEDIIAHVKEFDSGKYLFINPMVFDITRTNSTTKSYLGMDFWLPISVVKENEAVVWENDVLTMVHPTDSFSEFYSNSVESLLSKMQEYDNTVLDEDDDMASVIEEFMEAKEGNKVH